MLSLTASAGAWSRRLGSVSTSSWSSRCPRKALLDRLIAILAKPRPTVRVGDYYGPEPRRNLDPICSARPIAPPPDGTLLN